MKRTKSFMQHFILGLLIILSSLLLPNQRTNAEITSGGQEISLPSANNNYGNINYGLMNNELSSILLTQQKPLDYLNNLVTINQGNVVVYQSFQEMMSNTNGSSSVASGTVNDVTYYLKNGGINLQTGALFNVKIRFYTSDSSPLSMNYYPNDSITSIRYPSNINKAPIVWIEQTALDAFGNPVPNLNWITTTQLFISNEVGVFKSSEAPILFNLERTVLGLNIISEPASGSTMTSDGYLIMGGTGNVGGYVPNIYHGNVGWSGGAFYANTTTATLGIGASNYVQEVLPNWPTGHTGFVVPGTSYTVPYANASKTLLEMTNSTDSYAIAGAHTVGIMFPAIEPKKIISYVAIDPITGEKTKLTPLSPVDTLPSIPKANTKFVAPTTGPAIAGYTYKNLKIQDEISPTGKSTFAHGYTYIEYQYAKNSSVKINYQDELGNTIADTETLKGNVGDTYDTTSFRKEIGDYELVDPLPAETGVYQDQPTVITYHYWKNKLTLHIKQVALNHSSELVLPTKGYVTIKNVNKLKPEEVSSVSEEVNISFPSQLNDIENTGKYKINRSKTHDFYQVDLLLPQYYQNMGFVLTDTKVVHDEQNKQPGMPIFNGQTKTEYWLTLYIQPNTTSFNPYSWDYQIVN
ncbi:MucBP domain-containing protein [Isobaculum melis]|uniref:MucBP domain-containing protein n=1 Tax=Isobaculum melis TaxID=142588 RepID=A0A1H9UL39_9LACT|nr:MucBP domain-containing protein [Isobaculum melis]SES10059.1 MucBP domain-containing protein [Isobaculum melis]